MNIIHFDSLEDISKEAGKSDGYKAFKVKTSFGPEVAKLIVEPFGKVSPHKTDVDVIFYVIKGSLEVDIESEKFIIHENDMVEVPKGLSRSISNNHDIRAEFIIFRLTDQT